MKNKWYSKIWFLIIMLVLLIGNNFSANAKFINNSDVNDMRDDVFRTFSSDTVASYNKCYALDMVFLIDQSRSMNDPSHYSPNDPNNNRIEAVKSIIELLVQNQLYTCYGVQHRVAVISFWDEATVDLDFISLPETKEKWENTKDQIFAKITPKQEDGTNPIEAFKLANSLWENNSIPEDKDVVRKRAILLITDGHPCPTGMMCKDENAVKAYMDDFVDEIESDFIFNADLLARESNLGEILSLYKNDYSSVPDEDVTKILSNNPVEREDIEESTYIHVLALNAAEPYSEIAQKEFNSLVSSHGGNFMNLDTKDARDLGAKIQTVTSRLTMIKYIVAGCGEKPIQPYYARLFLYIFGNTEDTYTKITIGSPSNPVAQLYNGTGINTGDEEYFGFTGDYSKYGSNENYIFNKPPGGMWYFEASVCENIQINYLGLVASNFNLIEPQRALSLYDIDPDIDYDPNNPKKLSYQISGEVSNSSENSYETVYLTPDPNYPIEVIAKITDPLGHEKKLTLEYDGSNKNIEGVWTSVENLPTNVVGDYQIEIDSIITECVDSESFDCIRGGNLDLLSTGNFELPVGVSTYSVKNVSHISFDIVAPELGEVIPLHGSIFDKYPINPINISVQLLDENENPISYNKIFESKDEFLKAFAFENNSIVINGKDYKLDTTSVVFNSEMDSMDASIVHLLIDIENPKGSVDASVILVGDYKDDFLFSNTNDSQSFVIKDPFINSVRFFVILGVIFLLVLLGLILFYLSHASKPLRGQLIFTHNTQQGTQNKIRIGRKHWDSKKIGLPHVMGVSSKAVVNSLDKDSIKIKFSYVTKGNKQEMTLTSGSSVQMKGGIPYTVTYEGGKKMNDGGRRKGRSIPSASRGVHSYSSNRTTSSASRNHRTRPTKRK